MGHIVTHAGSPFGCMRLSPMRVGESGTAMLVLHVPHHPPNTWPNVPLWFNKSYLNYFCTFPVGTAILPQAAWSMPP